MIDCQKPKTIVAQQVVIHIVAISQSQTQIIKLLVINAGVKGIHVQNVSSPFQAQRSDEDEQKPHTNVQNRGRDRGYRGRYNQRGNRGQGRGTGVPSGSEELKE